MKRKDEILFILSVLAVTLLTIVTSIFIELKKQQFAFNDFANIGSILQGTFGVSVSLGGAYVAIRIARLGTSIVEKEKHRDDFIEYQKVFESSIQPFQMLGIAIQELYLLSIKLQKSQTHYEGIFFEAQQKFGDKRNEHGEFHPEYLKVLGMLVDDNFDKSIKNAVSDIISSLEQVWYNPYSHYIWINSATKKNTYNPIFSNKGFGSKTLDIRHDLSEVIFYLKIANSKHHLSIQDLITSQVMVNRITSIDNKKKEFDVLTGKFILLGGLLWTEPAFEDNSDIMNNLGAAIIYDIVTCIPSVDDIRLSLEEGMPEIFEKINIDTSPLFSITQKINNGLLYGKTIQDAYNSIKEFRPNFSNITLNSSF